MRRTIFTYHIHDVAPYINWIYFFHAWGFQPRFASIADIHGCDACRATWLTQFSEQERQKAAEAMQLHKEALAALSTLDTEYSTHAVVSLHEACSANDNIILMPNQASLPMLRQQHSADQGPCLSLADFVPNKESGKTTTIGLFAACADKEIEQLHASDPYRHLLMQTLADRLAEATAEKMHEEVRRTTWGYAPDEQLTIRQLHMEEFQGIRPAIGYPSLPDQSLCFLLDKQLQMNEIGISLTENGAMMPHASTCGLMFSHPKAQYFSIGHIAPDQLADYARRRAITLEEARKFLAGNL